MRGDGNHPTISLKSNTRHAGFKNIQPDQIRGAQDRLYRYLITKVRVLLRLAKDEYWIFSYELCPRDDISPESTINPYIVQKYTLHKVPRRV
jgi:hypothetical protein